MFELGLGEVFEIEEFVVFNDHLKGWMVRDRKSQSTLGYTRLRTQLVLYVFLSLAIAQRYPVRQQLRLDRAFATFTRSPQSANDQDSDPDNIKKIRLALNQA